MKYLNGLLDEAYLDIVLNFKNSDNIDKALELIDELQNEIEKL